MIRFVVNMQELAKGSDFSHMIGIKEGWESVAATTSLRHKHMQSSSASG